MTAETANTPAKRLYHCVQTMYLKNDVPRYQASYLGSPEAICAGLPARARPS